MKIFYSWQSDLPNSSNRGFIKDALENVAKKLRNDRSLDIEPRIDHDTAGVSGSPEIVGTIFSKIEQADIFVCDISIINGPNSDRLSPNPNVLVELGYALKALGENRLIMVFNSAFGKVEQLPFDLRARKVLPYLMPTLTDDRATERKKLESLLEQSIRSIRPRLSLSPRYIEVFQYESDKVKQFAYEQPRLWEYWLTVELLLPKIQDIREQYDDVINGLQYIKTIKVSNKDYFKFIQEKHEDLQKIVNILKKVFENIKLAWGPRGEPGNALKIKKVTDRFLSVCEAILSWEKEIDAVQPPEIFKELKEILRGGTTQIISEIESRVIEIRKILEQPNLEGTFEIIFTIKLPEDWAEKINIETKRIGIWAKENPNKWSNE